MPKGIAAPGKSLPPLVVPMRGLTVEAGSAACADALAAKLHSTTMASETASCQLILVQVIFC
jgi:hypothetical protein